MDAKTQAEYDRIKAGPHNGWFSLLHHNGPAIEQSDNVMARVEYILEQKWPAEYYTRLHHIRWIDPKVADDYAAKRNLLDDDCEAKRNLLDDDYAAKCKLLYDDYEAKRKLLYDDYAAKCKPLYDDYAAKRKLLYDDYAAKRKPLDDDCEAKRNLLDDDYAAKCKPLDDDVLSCIPDCHWNGTTIFNKT